MRVGMNEMEFGTEHNLLTRERGRLDAHCMLISGAPNLQIKTFSVGNCWDLAAGPGWLNEFKGGLEWSVGIVEMLQLPFYAVGVDMALELV